MLKIRLTAQDYGTLFTWTREVAKISVSNRERAISKAAQLLTRIVLQIEGEPPRPAKAPKLKRHRPFGSNNRFEYDINLSQPSESAPVRALWVWGHERGCRNVAESFRLLLTKIRETYFDLGKTPNNELGTRLLAFRVAIEEKSHFAEEIKAPRRR